MPEFGGIYSQATVLRYMALLTGRRAEEDLGYAFLPEPAVVGFVNVAAYKDMPTEEKGGEVVFSGKLRHNFKKKIEAILGIALENGHGKFCVFFSSSCKLSSVGGNRI